MIVYGRRAVREAIRGPRRVKRVWAIGGAAGEEWLAEAGVPVKQSPSPAELQRLCGSPSHQGVAAEVQDFRYADADDLLGVPDALLIALDEIQDPQNLGAICRTAEAAGAAGVVIPAHRAAEVTAAVCNASAGAVEHLPVARVRNLADFLGDAKQRDFWCYGASADASTRYDGIDWKGPTVIALGSEGKGLRPRVAAACDDLVSVPLHGRVESLNVSATAAILLYEADRRRRG